jgi:hypothetical protein
MAERTADTRPGSDSGPVQPPVTAAESPRRRHCRVTRPDPGAGPWPGLVAEWQQTPEGWRARVYVVGETDSATTVETWVAAAHLRPA